MSKNIFPSEILNFTAEQEVAKHSKTSQAIYIALVVVVLGCLIALPYVYVDVTVQSKGLIRPSQSVSQINSPINGQVSQVLFKENDQVAKNDTLLIVESNHLKQEASNISQRVNEVKSYIKDLKLLQSTLTNSAFKKTNNLISPTYLQQYNEFKQKVSELNTAYLKAKKDFNRTKKLFEAQAVAKMEYEQAEFELNQTLASFKNFHQTQLTAWSSELQQHGEELNRLILQQTQLDQKAKNYIITSPVSGSIQGMKGLTKGVHVFSGKSLFNISPSAEMIVQTYLSPKDIGLIKQGMNAKFQVDAFNYNQWGFVTGNVIEISKDIIVQDKRPVFEVKCSLDRSQLKLKNGYIGKLKKGMTTQVRFIVAERSLWQLLYDKVDNWLNPNA